MKKYIALIGLLSLPAVAHEFRASVDLLEGTYVGEETFYYPTEFSDLPGFYHEKNTVEYGISIYYIHELEDWDIFGKWGFGNSDLRYSRTGEVGAQYRLNKEHWFAAKFKGTYAKEMYELDTRILDPEHTNVVTNGEWAEWWIARYRYNLEEKTGYPLYLGAEAVLADNDPALVEDDYSAFVGFEYKKFWGELKAGEELVALSLGLRFNMDTLFED